MTREEIEARLAKGATMANAIACIPEYPFEWSERRIAAGWRLYLECARGCSFNVRRNPLMGRLFLGDTVGLVVVHFCDTLCEHLVLPEEMPEPIQLVDSNGQQFLARVIATDSFDA